MVSVGLELGTSGLEFEDLPTEPLVLSHGHILGWYTNNKFFFFPNHLFWHFFFPQNLRHGWVDGMGGLIV